MQTISSRQRNDKLDFLKGVFIVLMISFHLVYIGDMYPYAKRVVYTFHMPAFLIISGYLMNIAKPGKDFLKSMLGYAIPYVIMESGYIVMASVLPIREHIDSLTAGVFLDKLFLHPIGPYWYLQTLLICGLCYHLVFRLFPIKMVSRLILLGLIYYIISDCWGVMSLACSLYFLAGVTIRQSALSFEVVFQDSEIAILAIILLAVHPQNLQMDATGGVLMVFLVISWALWVYAYAEVRVRRLLSFLGRNTLPLLLFSPIFTFLCKPLVPLLQFEPSGIVFLLLSLFICIAGSLSIDKAMTLTGLSRYFYLCRHSGCEHKALR